MYKSLQVLLSGTVALACLSSGVTAAQDPYAQCGGIGWTGDTTCTEGWTCVVQNPYYSQCVQASSSATPVATSSLIISSSAKTSSSTVVVVKAVSSSSKTTSSTKTTTTTKSSTTTKPSTTTKTTSSIKTSSTSAVSTGLTYKASFTHYGAGDGNGSPNCNTNTAACGFYTYPGYSAAVSQNLYGAGPGAGAGPACGTCWKLVGQTDSSGNALSNAGTSIVVMVNNLCPADGNPLCAQNGLSGTNQDGANVNFDLCSDSGAEAAFFQNDGVGLAVGTATQVSCSQWSGTVVS